MRLCFNCGSDKTNLLKGKYPRWCKYNEKWYCNKCRLKLFVNPMNHGRRILFKNSQITLKQNPRKGICKICGSIVGVNCKRTSIHHEQYHDDDPLKDTVEVCNSCHGKITMKTYE